MSKPSPPPHDDSDVSHKFGFLQVLRLLERDNDGKPRIGTNRRIREELADLGQDPFLEFPDNDLSELDLEKTIPSVRPRFLGFFGPYGALPLAVTREVAYWVKNGDRSFVRFTDIFTSRFIQLFYRSWSDARPITQFDHPSGGSFPEHLRALTGDAGPAYAERGAIDDVSRLRYTALALGRVKTPLALERILAAHFGIGVRVEEFVTSWLDFAPEDRSMMGVQAMALGESVIVGARTATTSDKITLHLECDSLEQYKSFLPGRDFQAQLKDLVLSYIGPFLSIDVAVWLPGDAVAPAELGKNAELGWMAALPVSAPPVDQAPSKVMACQYALTEH